MSALPDQLTSNNHSSLVDTNFVRFVRQRNADYVFALIDSGELQWVWNIAENRKTVPRKSEPIRELRFWVDEVLAPQMTASLTIDEAIDKILPVSRSRFCASEIGQLLLISRVKVVRLCRSIGGKMENRTFKVPRSNVAEYLRKTWVGKAES